MKRTYTLVVFFLMLCIEVYSQNQTSISFTVNKDATIFSEDSLGANGAGSLYAGRTNQNALRRAIVSFDISEIPSNALVDSVALTIRGTKGEGNISLHRATSAWVEGRNAGLGSGGGQPNVAVRGDVTWTFNNFSSSEWLSEGGDFVDGASATSQVESGLKTNWESEQLILDVQNWISGTNNNHGWFLIGDESTTNSTVRMDPRESGVNAPKLLVYYSIPEICEESGGVLEGGPFEFCVGDGVPDLLMPNSVTLTSAISTNTVWVITDSIGNILSLTENFTEVNFDNAAAGVCLLWHLSYDDGIQNLETGENVESLQGCFSFSNSIRIVRKMCQSGPTCEVEGGTLVGGPFTFCVGDGVKDTISDDQIMLSDNTGSNSEWLVTDIDGSVLSISGSYRDLDFDNAGLGTCLLWHLSFDIQLGEAAMDSNSNSLNGCFGFSNPIRINRIDCDTMPGCDLLASSIAGGPFDFCVGDSIPDTIGIELITVTNPEDANSIWVITDTTGNILGLPDDFSTVNFEDAGVGVCLLWHLNYESGITGLTVGQNTSDLGGCFSLSNAIQITRTTCDTMPMCDVNGGLLEGGPFSFCVGDGVPETIGVDAIILSGELGTDSKWVVTDTFGIILGLLSDYTTINFDVAGEGVCLLWHLSYDGGIKGATLDSNVNNIEGCFSLSNAIQITRTTCDTMPICDVSGGVLEGGPFSFCIGDGVADTIASEAVTLSGNSGMNSQWVVTDTTGKILGLPGDFSAVDFDGAGEGVCLLWHLSFDGELTGAVVDSNANNLGGCYSLSNALQITRTTCDTMPMCDVSGGVLEGGPFSFCIGDGVVDTIASDAVTLSGNSGMNSQWVVTDTTGKILGLPGDFSAVDFDGAGEGVCLLWHLSFDGELTGAEVDSNANNLGGCYSLSNALQITRTTCDTMPMCDVSGGALEGGPFSFCIGDGVADTIASEAVTLSGNSGMNSQWVVTDTSGKILGLPGDFSAVDFDGAGEGVCLLWHLSFDGELTGAEVDSNANNLVGCYSLSNSLQITRTTCDTMPMCDVSGGVLEGGPFSFCIGDGVADTIASDAVTLSGNSGMNSQWVVTDTTGKILGLPGDFSAVDFDGAGEGVCLLWHLSFDGELTGAEADSNANDLGGCYSLSNALQITRTKCDTMPMCDVSGGVLEGGPFSFCIGDGVADTIASDAVTLSGNSGMNSQWVVTDTTGKILGLPGDFSAVDFDGAGEGVCLLWHLNFDGELTGAEVDSNANNLGGCYSLSNALQITRTTCDTMPMCDVSGGVLSSDPNQFCVDDGLKDTIPEGSISLNDNSGPSSQWIVTDEQGEILGLPENIYEVDFDGAGAGNCLVWNLSFQDSVSGLVVGNNASDIEGCFSLSNSVSVVRLSGDDCPRICNVSGGTLSGGPFEFCVDGVPDNVSGINVVGVDGPSQSWIITDQSGAILGIPATLSSVNFDDAGVGVCFIWNIAYEDDLAGLEVGNNVDQLVGCYELSNSITVIRRQDGSVCTPQDCNAPTAAVIEVQSESSFSMSWEAVPGARAYYIRIRYAGQSKYLLRTRVRNPRILVYGPSLRDYEIQIQSECANGVLSDYSEVFLASTSKSKTPTNAQFDGEIQIIELPSKGINDLNVYPNPLHQLLNVEYISSVPSEIRILDTKGRLLHKAHNKLGLVGNEIDLGNVQSGLYLVQIITSDGQVFVEKVFKM